MHFHLPKPLHGWREFVGEVGIIVIGVLIALVAEQVVEDWRWGISVAQTRQSLNAELAHSRFAALERLAVYDCLTRQLDALDAITDEASVPPKLNLGGLVVGLREWSTSTWDAAAASGVAAHMSVDERNRYARLFGLIKPIGALHMEAFKTANELLTLANHRRLTDVSRARLQIDIAQLRGLNGILRLGSQQLVEQTEPLHLKIQSNEQAGLNALRHDWSCPLPSPARMPVAANAAR